MFADAAGATPKYSTYLNLNSSGGFVDNFLADGVRGKQQSYIYFGQSGNAPIKWRVLDAGNTSGTTENSIFLLAETQMPSRYDYNDDTTVTGGFWTSSKIRAYLNGFDKYSKGSLDSNTSFFYTNFISDSERAAIADTQLTTIGYKLNSENDTTGTLKGNFGYTSVPNPADYNGVSIVVGTTATEYGLQETTKDKVFLLNQEDYVNTDYGFAESPKGYNPYVNGYYAHGPQYGAISGTAGALGCAKLSVSQWLRSPGWCGGRVAASDINYNGNFYLNYEPNNDDPYYRPAFNLSSDSIIYATTNSAAISPTFTAPVAAPGGVPAYRLFIKDANYDANTQEFATDAIKPKLSLSKGNLLITYNNFDNISGKLVVLLSNPNSTDGAVAYQAAAPLSNGINTASFNVSSISNFSEYSVSLLMVSDKNGTNGSNFSESVYCSYTTAVPVKLSFYNYLGGDNESQITVDNAEKYENYIPKSNISLPVLQNANRILLGWTKYKSGTVAPITALDGSTYFTEDTKLYACWAPKVEPKVTFSTNAAKDNTVIYGTPLNLTATMDYGSFTDGVLTSQWKDSKNSQVGTSDTATLTLNNVVQSGVYTYEFAIQSKSEPLFKYSSTATSPTVTISKANLFLKQEDFKIAPTTPAYPKRPITEIEFEATIRNAAGTEVVGTPEWQDTFSPVAKGTNTRVLLFTPTSDADKSNYDWEGFKPTVTFQSEPLNITFYFTQWKEGIDVEAQYGLNYNSDTIIEMFKSVYDQFIGKHPELAASLSKTVPYLGDGDGVEINKYNDSFPAISESKTINVKFNNKTYSVTVNQNFDGGTKETYQYGYGQYILDEHLTVPTHPQNWLFRGWFVTDSEGNISETEWNNSTNTVTHDLILSAQWDQVIYTLTSLTVKPLKSSYEATVALTDGDLEVTAVYTADGAPDVKKVLTWDEFSNGITYDGGGTAPRVDAKGITVSYTDGVKVTSDRIELNVVPKNVDSEVASLKDFFKKHSVVYDGNPHTITIPQSAYGDTTALAQYIADIEYVITNASGPVDEAVKVGTYTVRAIFTPASANYVISDMTATLTITPGKTEITVSWDDTKLSFVYNGEAQFPTPIIKDINGTVLDNVDLDMAFSGSPLVDNKPVNVGSYTVTVSLSADDEAYTLSATSVLTANFGITQLVIAKPTVNGTLTYNGDTQSVETLLQGYDSKYMELKQSVTGKDADEYRVMVEIISPDNVSWGGGTSINLTWEIKKKSISAQWDKFKFVVTDSVVIPKVTSLDGIVDDIIVNCENGRDILIVYNNGEPATEVGSYKAVASLNGSDGWKKNYVLDRNTEWDYVILPKDGVTVVDIEWDTDTFEYDGKGHTPTAVVKDMDGNEITVNIVYKGDKGAVWAKDGGYTVSVELPEEYFIRKDKSCNYNIVENNDNEGGLDDPENPNNPDSKKVTVEWSATELKYNGSAQHPTVTVKDLQGNVLTDVVVRYTGDTDAVWAKIGKYSVTVSVTGYSIVGDNATCEFTIVANDEGKGGLDDPKNPNNTSKEPDTGNEGGGIPKDFPLWQTIVSGISIVLIIALGAKIISDAGKIKKLNKKTEKAKAQAVYSATFGTDMLLMGSLAMQARWWSAIAIGLAGLALLMVVIAFVIRGKVNKAEEAYEEAEKRAVESERRKRDEEMKMMFMMLNNRGGAGGYDQTNVEGTTVYPDQNIEQIVQRVVTALLPSTTHTESVETNSENDAMARLIEQQSEMIDKQARIIEQMQMNQNVLDDDFDDEEDNDYYDEEDDFYEQELAADGEAQPVYEAEVLLDEAKPRIPSNFRMRLKVSSVKNHDAYVAIKNKLCSKKEITFRISGRTEKVKYHGEVIAIIGVARKSLKLWLALDPNSIEQSRYHQKDVSDKPRYAHVPMLLRVGSDRALKRAMEVLDILFETYSIEDRRKYKDKSLQELAYTLKRNALVRNKRVELLRDSIHVHDADALTNEEAAQYVEYKAREAYEYENFATITLDVLEENFYDGQKVTLDKLKHKGLIPEEYNGYVITTGERLTKPLYVVADGYSAVAVKMIVLTGGRAIQLAEVTHEDVQ